MAFDLPPVEQDFSHLSDPDPDGWAKNNNLVESARQAWEARYSTRQRRRRARNYFRGDQWEESVDPDTGEVVNEADRIREQNRIPWVMNEIRPIVNQLRGQFREGYAAAIAVARNREDSHLDDLLTMALEQIHDRNEASEVDADEFLEVTLSGAFGWKITARWWDQFDQDDVSIDPIDQNRLFYNPDLNDRRMRDLRFIGEIHDWTIDEVIRNFASNPREAEELREIYANVEPKDVDEFMGTWSGFDAADALHWYWPSDPKLCRVIEIWKKEYRWQRYAHDQLDGSYTLTELSDQEIELINQERIQQAEMLGLYDEDGQLIAPIIEVDVEYEGIWRCHFLSPDGHVLFEADTPFWHDEHPYVIGFPVLLDGEHWGIVEDIIDPQRLMNRMTASIDFMFGTAAKGILLVPEDSIPKGMDINDFADEWTRFGGAIKFKAKPNHPLPQQITANAVPAGIFTWLTQQRDWMQKISSVNAPMQGQDPEYAGTTATQYQAQIQQGSTSQKDYFDSFYVARRKRDLKALQVAAQFYDRRLVHSPAKKKGGIEWRPELVQGLDMSIVVQEVQDTATTRQLWEADLKEHLNNGRLTFRQFLEMSSHPKADALIAVIQQTNPALLGQPVSPELIEAAQAGDPDAIAIIEQAQDFGGAPMAPAQAA